MCSLSEEIDALAQKIITEQVIEKQRNSVDSYKIKLSEERLQEQEEMGSANSSSNTANNNNKNVITNKKVYRSDFQILKFLGKGSYGKVYQVRMINNDKDKENEIDTNKIFAMKAVKKRELKGNLIDIRHTRTERDVLTRTKHPFLVKLYYAFETSNRVYLIQEFLRGGELFRRIEKETMFLEDTAKFYLTEIILALEYLHGLNVIYRDLKSENVLLNYDGHVKLIDFGLSKMGMSEGERTSTFCGTVEYMAPEVVARSGHGKPADWWSVGAFAFDILNGFTPFHSENKKKLMEKIKKADVKFPPYMTPDSKDFIRKLLRKNEEKRLGSSKGAEELKSHRFFREIKWDKVYNREYEPPYIPSAVSDEDVSEFDQRFTSRSPRESTEEDGIDAESPEPEDRMFEDFDYSYSQRSTETTSSDDDESTEDEEEEEDLKTDTSINEPSTVNGDTDAATDHERHIRGFGP